MPFGIPNAGSSARPAFADIDDDGDLDLFVGNRNGNTLFLRNTGSANSPAFKQQKETNPLESRMLAGTPARP